MKKTNINIMTEEVALEIVNILASHKVPINCTDIIFNAVKEKIDCQHIMPIQKKEK